MPSSPLAASQNMSAILLLVGVTAAILIPRVQGHGRMMDPPSRNSMWRLGFSNPVNYNDNELYCGGRVTQWARNKGKCGVCGDAYHTKREHEMGGKYANGIVTRDYVQGDVINTTIHITANHRGYFEFRLCPVEDNKVEVTQRCLDTNVLERENGQGTKYFLPEGKSNQFFNVSLRLPPDVTCERCVIQWKYRTGNTWDKNEDGEFCVGCGPQEEFYNCADVSIHPGNPGTKWRPRVGKGIRSEASAKLSDYGRKKVGYLSQRAGKKLLNSPTKTFNVNLADTMKEVFKEDELENSIADYNKRMYGHLLMRNPGLSLGPTAVPFKWKAGNPDAGAVDKIYSRFGYGNSRRFKGNDRRSEDRGSGRERNLNSGEKGGSSRLRVQDQIQSSKLRWKSGRLINSDTPGAVSVYSQTLGVLRSTPDKTLNFRSASPFTPPPPNGDPDLLRIFPIYGTHPHHGVERKAPPSTETRAAEAVPNMSSLYRPKDSVSVRQFKKKKGQPRWLRRSLRERRRRVNPSTRKYKSDSDTNLVENYKQTTRRNKLHNRRGKTRCETGSYDPYCHRTVETRPESFHNDMVHPGKTLNGTVSYPDYDDRDYQDEDFGLSKQTSETYGDNIEVLINFLATLLNEQSKTSSNRKRNNRRHKHARTDTQGQKDFSDDFSRTASDMNPESLNPPRSEISEPQVSRLQRRWSPKSSDGFIGTTDNEITTNEYEPTALQPNKNRRRLYVDKHNQRVKHIPDNTFRKRSGFSNWSPYGRNGELRSDTSVDQSFDHDQDFNQNRPHVISDDSVDNLAWESKAARDNRETMREYRRRMKRVGDTQFSNEIGTRSRFPLRSNAESRLNRAETAGVPHTYRHSYRQNTHRNRLEASLPLDNQTPYSFPHGVQDLSPLRPQPKSSTDSEAFFPEPHPISIPETESFTNFRLGPSLKSTVSLARRKFKRRINHYNGEGTSISFDFQDSANNKGRSTIPNISHQWQSLSKRQPNLEPSVFSNSRTQNVLPTVASSPNPHYASTYLETPLAVQYPTGSPARVVCKSLITLSGGMDQWCSDNCHANFCPPSTCVCYTEGQLDQPAQSQTWRPTAQIPTARSYRPGHRRFANINSNYNNDFTSNLEGLAEPVPLASPEISFRTPLFTDATRKSSTPKLVDRQTFSPNTFNLRNSRISTYNYNNPNIVPPSHTHFQFPQNQEDLAASQIYELPESLDETSIHDVNIATLNNKRHAPPMSTLNSAHNTRISRRKHPIQYLPTILPSKPFTPESAENNNRHDIDNNKSRYHNNRHDIDNNKSRYHTRHEQNSERTVPYHRFPHQTNGTLQRNEVDLSSSQPSPFGCVAIGAYSGIQHFDEWCTVTCQQTMCPLLLCSCQGYGYN